jgi:hypothetical protein
MSGTSGNIRRRATGQTSEDEDSRNKESSVAGVSMRNTAAVAASRGGFARQRDFQMAVLLRLAVVLIVVGTLCGVSHIVKKSKEAELEPLPTLAELEAIVASWEQESVLSVDATQDQIDILSGSSPLGPIPYRLWLPDCEHTDAAAGFTSSNPKKQCKENVENTIHKHHKAWMEQKKTQQFQRQRRAMAGSGGGGGYPEVKYLTDGECLLLIELAKEELLAPFRVETNNDFKYDICRIAALYLYGGYYFDVEVQVIDPVLLRSGNEKVSFITAVEASEKGFFEAFVASSPKHPILKRTLDKMAEYYNEAYVEFEMGGDMADDDYVRKPGGDDDDGTMGKGMMNDRRGGDDDSGKLGYIDAMVQQAKMEQDPSWKLGPRTLKDAYISLSPEARGETLLLQEINLDPPEEHGHWYPNVERRRDVPNQQCCCNYIVHDPRTKTPYLYSRAAKTKFC